MDVKRVIADDAEPFRQIRRRLGNQVTHPRRRRRPALWLIGAGLCFLAGLAGAGFYAVRTVLLHSPRFALRRIEIGATDHAPQADLRRAMQRHLGRNIFRLDLERMERDLEETRWVKRAVVKRVFPNGVACAVEERTPAGLALLGDRVWLVDGEGVGINPYAGGERRYSFPILVNAEGRGRGPARERIARGVALVGWLRAEQPLLLADISEIDIGRDDRFDVRLDGGGPVVRLHPRDYGNNLERYLAMREYLATGFGGGGYVDLRFRDRIAFRPHVTREQ